jgi:predicted lipoprotein with Yx(FWY)xxD motif
MFISTRIARLSRPMLLCSLVSSGCAEQAGGLVISDAATDETTSATTPIGSGKIPDAATDAATDAGATASASAPHRDAAISAPLQESGVTADAGDAAATPSTRPDAMASAIATLDSSSTSEPQPDAAASSPIATSGDAGGTDAGLTPIDDAGPPSWPSEQSCVFSSPPVAWEPGDAGVAGDGGDAGPPPGPHVTLNQSPFLGPYLADRDGFALYIYTADFPGNCETPPVSTCFDDCLQAWPVFEAWDRELEAGLDGAAFGSFMRSDGVRQTTYFGWPLYYYNKDIAPELTLGQAKGKVWYLAEQVMPNLVMMRAPEELEGIKYLADGNGHTLYSFSGDQPGTETELPVPACEGTCATEFRPFTVRSLRAVTTLEPADLSVFSTAEGLPQVSFRGQPLYLANDDTHSGTMNGLANSDFSLVVP